MEPSVLLGLKKSDELTSGFTASAVNGALAVPPIPLLPLFTTVCKRTAIASAFLSMLLPSSAQAQDIFQTGQTERSYNYVQVRYLFDQDPVKNPLQFNLLYNLYKNFSLSVEYLDLAVSLDRVDANNNTVNIRSGIVETSVGINYHQSIERWSRVDWLASLHYQRAKLSASSDTQGSLSIEYNSLVPKIGLRASLTPRIEVQAEIATFISDEELGDESKITVGDERLDLTGVLRISNHVDLAVGALNAQESPNYNMGVRVSW